VIVVACRTPIKNTKDREPQPSTQSSGVPIREKAHRRALPVYHVHERGPVAQLDRASDFGSEGWGFDSLRGRQCARGPSLGSGFRLRAQTPAERLKFDSLRGRQCARGPSLGSGFRLRAQTPAERLKFDSLRGRQCARGPSLGSGFRLRAQTPAERLKFDSLRGRQLSWGQFEAGRLIGS
jgi:hypothetical protein